MTSYAERRKAESKTPTGDPALPPSATVAREVCKLLTNPPVVPDGGDLRHQRTNSSLTLTDIATAPEHHPHTHPANSNEASNTTETSPNPDTT